MKIKKDFTLRTVMGQNVVMAEGANADSFGKLITLNSSAALLWNELQGKTFTAETAAAILTDKYGIPADQALADATHLLTRLASRGLIDL